MAKTKTIKTESIEFGIANSSRVFTNFDAEKGFSLDGYFSKKESHRDYDSMALMVFLCHQSFTKIQESELVLKSKDHVLDLLSIMELQTAAAIAIEILFHSNTEIDPKAVKKK